MTNDISQRSGMSSLVKTIGAVTTLAGLAVVGLKSRDEIEKWSALSYDRKDIAKEFMGANVDKSLARMFELHQANQTIYGLFPLSLPELAREGQELRAKIALFHKESTKGPVPAEILIAERDLSDWQASLKKLPEEGVVTSPHALSAADLTDSLGAIIDRVQMAQFHEVVGRRILKSMDRTELREHCDSLWQGHLNLTPTEIVEAIVYIKTLRASEANENSFATCSSYLGWMHNAIGDHQAAKIEYLRAISLNSTTSWHDYRNMLICCESELESRKKGEGLNFEDVKRIYLKEVLPGNNRFMACYAAAMHYSDDKWPLYDHKRSPGYQRVWLEMACEEISAGRVEGVPSDYKHDCIDRLKALRAH